MTNEEAFEKWFCGDDYRETLLEKDKNGNYKYQSAYFAYKAWQAAIFYIQEQGKLAEQSEHVATIYNGIAYWIGKEPPEGTNLFTTPQRQQPLKRLNESDIKNIYDGMDVFTDYQDLANAIMDEMERINK